MAEKTSTGKTTAQKLAIKPGARIWTTDPERFAVVGTLPDGAALVDDLPAAGVAVYFVDDAAGTTRLLTAAGDALTRTPTIWIAYPKANRTDINRDSLWPLVVPFGLRPNGQIAIDEVWSALRFRANKPGEDVFSGGKKA